MARAWPPPEPCPINLTHLLSCVINFFECPLLKEREIDYQTQQISLTHMLTRAAAGSTDIVGMDFNASPKDVNEIESRRLGAYSKLSNGARRACPIL